MICRCGHDGADPHPCHGNGYTCRRPATERIYPTGLTALAGAQLKVGAADTWACNECWEAFREKLRNR